jgi:hypothetical protein
MEKKLSFMKIIMRNFGVRMLVYNETLYGLENYDDGLRSRLFKTHDIKRLESFIRSLEPEALYLTEDLYGCYYCFFSIAKVSENGGGGGVNIVASDHGFKICQTTRLSTGYLKKTTSPII